LARHTIDPAFQPRNPGLDLDVSNGGIRSDGQRHQQHRLLVEHIGGLLKILRAGDFLAVVVNLFRNKLFRHRPTGFSRRDAFGQFPVESGRNAGGAGILPIGMPAGRHFQAHRGGDRVARLGGAGGEPQRRPRGSRVGAAGKQRHDYGDDQGQDAIHSSIDAKTAQVFEHIFFRRIGRRALPNPSEHLLFSGPAVCQ
jgi:hypothetical protein